MSDQVHELTPADQASVDDLVLISRFLRRRHPEVFTRAELAAVMQMDRARLDVALDAMTAHGDRAALEVVYRGRRTGAA